MERIFAEFVSVHLLDSTYCYRTPLIKAESLLIVCDTRLIFAEK